MTALPAAVAATGLAHIAARYAGPRWAAAVLKPVPIALLAATLAVSGAPVDHGYRWLVVAGLVCSMAGDVWLLFPQHFRRGLASFLVAHLFYIAAFSRGGAPGVETWFLLVPFVLVSAVMLGYLWPHLARERGAVVVYVAVLAVMGWAAATRAWRPAPGGLVALLGAAVFMTSDGTLAVDHFARPFRAADGIVMATYYAAQTLITASALA